MEVLPIVAVLGPGQASPELEALAARVGGLAAAHGWVVLTGGGPGVMAAASRGAVEAGGLTVGILPNARPAGGYPNRWVKLPIFTGAGMARNAFNVLSARLCVALGGGPGTLSEIALALKAGVRVWCLGSWRLEPPAGASPPQPRLFASEAELLAALEQEMARREI
jgi:uncharacterized protein (TIGR00725 family)